MDYRSCFGFALELRKRLNSRVFTILAKKRVEVYWTSTFKRLTALPQDLPRDGAHLASSTSSW